jgi:hypothetical protein
VFEASQPIGIGGERRRQNLIATVHCKRGSRAR